MGKTFKIAGISLVAILILGAAAFIGIQLVSAQQQAPSQAAPAQAASTEVVPTQAAPAQSPSASQSAAPQAAAEKGLVVVAVDSGSPAEKAGLKRGDILLKINDTEINTGADLKTALSSLKSGDAVVLSVTHGDESRVLTATAGDQNGAAYLGFTTWGGQRMLRGFGGGGTMTLQPGAAITSVVSGSPAEKAGLKPGDIILAVNGKDLSATYALADAIGSFKPGDTVTLKVQSGANTSDVQATLGENPQTAGKAYLGVEYTNAVEKNGNAPQGQMPMPFFRGGPFGGNPGGTPQTIPNGMSGVAIMQVTPGSPAAQAGLKVDDVILAVDGNTVDTAQNLIDAIAAHKVGDAVMLTIENISGNSTDDVRVVLGENPQAAGKAYLGVQVVSLSQLHQNVTPGQPAPVLPNNGNNTNG